jgi:hypothetical protein
MKIKFGLAGVLIAFAGSVSAHHSYNMFDGSQTLTVTGSVAKLEWRNPHVFVWVYVRDANAEGGYELYAFENGSPNVLARIGWSKDVLQAGEQIAIAYWPLRDGRSGGHLLSATRADGSELSGAGGPNAASEASAINPQSH